MRQLYLYERESLLISSCSDPAAYVICGAYVTDAFVLPPLKGVHMSYCEMHIRNQLTFSP